MIRTTQVDSNVPGVYIQEVSSNSLAISQQQTAVPVFFTENMLPDHNSEEKIENWNAFLAIIQEYDANNVTHRAIKAYLDNGGGPFYLIYLDDIGNVDLSILGKLYDATLLVQSGLSSQQSANKTLTQAMDDAAADGKYFLLYDGSQEELTASAEGTLVLNNDKQNKRYAAEYYPWLKDISDNAIPPSSVMAGIICRVDAERGVWKAPAGVGVTGDYTPQFVVTDELQDLMNDKEKAALNAIRDFPIRGTMIWGARTLDTTDSWRYVSVRRLFNSVERDIQLTLQSVVFENNNQPTWERVRNAIDSYLWKIWKAGGLKGDDAEQAYFINIGKDISMTEEDILNGKMIVEVGLATVRPAEFIVVKFSQIVGASA